MPRAYQHGVLSVQVRTHIGTRLVGSQGISVATVIGFVAAADTSSSFFFVDCLRDYAVSTAPPPGSLRAQPSHTTMVNKRLLMHARAAIKNAEELQKSMSSPQLTP